MGSEARSLTRENAAELAHWCGGRLVTEHDALDHESTSPGVNVPVGNDVERASLGDLIIHNNDGTFTVFKN
jgi:hypothetical protein